MKSARITAYLILSLYSTTGASVEITQLDNEIVKILTPAQQLGQQIFFDKSLSSPGGEACASCHDPKDSFTDSNFNAPSSDGVLPGRSGARNAPTIMYSAFSPVFHLEKTETESLYIGGQFYDGRAGNLSEQAKGPFLDPDEMNNKDEAEVVGKLRNAPYANLFKQVYGINALVDVKQAYQNMVDAIAQFENTPIFHPFSSKYDYFLAGEATFTEQELRGLAFYEDEKKGNCAACHPSKSETSTPPLFTDFSYDNLGLPSNQSILGLKGVDFIDLGLGKVLNDPKEIGKFKVPTLRNIAKTAPYTHNGGFNNLRDVVEFYSTRDTDPKKWGKPEVAENVNKEELGDLKLTPDEIDDIVAFLNTLTDGYDANNANTFTNNTGIAILPVIKIEGKSVKTTLVSAKFEKVENSSDSLFRLTAYEVLKNAVPSAFKEVARYSLDNNLLEIPLITVDGTTPYVAQLKRIENTSDNVFELIYAKQLQ